MQNGPLVLKTLHAKGMTMNPKERKTRGRKAAQYYGIIKKNESYFTARPRQRRRVSIYPRGSASRYRAWGAASQEAEGVSS